MNIKGVGIGRGVAVGPVIRMAAPLPEPESEKYTVDVPLPETGFKACYVDLIYRTDDGRQYKISTRIFMTDPGKLL